MTLESLTPSYADVCLASQRLKGVAHHTPVMTSQTLNDRLGAQVFFKCEHLQRGGAFKFRGAYNAIAALTDAQRAAGVVAFSSGNHAQGVALASRLLGLKATIIMPSDAPQSKITATRSYGAQVIHYDRATEDRNAIALDIQQRTGMFLVPPFDDENVISGQGTAAKELFEEVGELDALMVCLGGGGLLAGSALAASVLSPQCKVYGVEPEAGNDVQQSFRSGVIVHIKPPQSIADGALTLAVGNITFPIIQRLVTDILTVTDLQLIQTLKFFAERMNTVVEPTGCLGAAAVQHGALAIKPNNRIGVIISGGNVDLLTYSRYLSMPT
jgi:threonine dehydratase